MLQSWKQQEPLDDKYRVNEKQAYQVTIHPVF